MRIVVFCFRFSPSRSHRLLHEEQRQSLRVLQRQPLLLSLPAVLPVSIRYEKGGVRAVLSTEL